MIFKGKPRSVYVWIRPFIEEYAGEIKTLTNQTLTCGEVLAVGPKVEPDITIGSIVYYSKHSGVKFRYDDDKSEIQLKDQEIIAIKDDINGVEIEIGRVGYTGVIQKKAEPGILAVPR
jgi:co-chaperonin GroES (HSP10)